MKVKRKKQFKNFIEKYKKETVIALLLFAGLAIRLYFVDKYISISGDLLLYADWGRRTVIYGLSEFYRAEIWEYAPPNYPPIINLIYSFAFRVFEHRYYFAELHNLIKIPPTAFLHYFDEFGYYFMIKIPGILADLGLSLLIYWFIYKFSKSGKKALAGMCFMLFNPVLIFTSAVWGQYDSLIALLSLLSFYFLVKKMPEISFPLMFVSLYIKPNWLVFIPLYAALLTIVRPDLRKMFLGAFLSLILFFLVSFPFSQGNTIEFTYWLFSERIFPTVNAGAKASISAFNLHTVFLDYDISPDNSKIAGIPANILGTVLFSITYIGGIMFLLFSKNKLKGSLAAIFTIAFGSYLFMTNMLERYFFAGFVPMVVLMFTSPKLLLAGIVLNLTVFANLVYAFFRRSTGAIAEPFNVNNFLLMRLISTLSVGGFLAFVFLLYKDIRLKMKEVRFNH